MAPHARRAGSSQPRSPRAPKVGRAPTPPRSRTGTPAYRQAHRYGQLGQRLPEGLSGRADADPNIDTAYDAGANGLSFEQWADEHLESEPKKPSSSPRSPAGGTGRRPRRRGPLARRSVIPSSAPAPPGLRTATGIGQGGVAGLAVGVVLYALILAVIDYGPKGPGLWLRAKFLNIPASAPTGSTSGTTETTPATTTAGPAAVSSANVPQALHG